MDWLAMLIVGLTFAVSQCLFFIAISSHRAAPRRNAISWIGYAALIVAAAANLVLYAAHIGIFFAARLQGVELWRHVSTVLN